MPFQLLGLFALVLSWMLSLVPDRDHSELAFAIALVSGTREQAALMTAVAFRESSLRNEAVGDGGHSFCAFQIHDSSGGGPALLEDVGACVSRADALLRRSARLDPAHPVAAYARGPQWRTKEAQRISNDRVSLARRLLMQ